MVQCFPAKGVHFVPVLYGHEINIKTQINILVLCFPILFQYHPKHNIIMQTLHLVSVFAFSTTPIVNPSVIKSPGAKAAADKGG